MTNIDSIIKIRKKLHQNPELSGNEKLTSKNIFDIISRFNPSEIIRDIAGYGIAFVFDSSTPGRCVLLRCELDALPINEENDFEYKSKNQNCSHSCGHDGHMAIMVGLASQIQKKPPFSGKIILFFQPSEETGKGAKLAIKDNKLENLKPDFVFALHNIPKYQKNKIIIREGTFTCASKGMIIKLLGKTSHAAEPEKGINPALATSRIIEELISLSTNKETAMNFTLITIVHVLLGEIAFGTSAGYAEIRATFRASENEDLDLLWKFAEKQIFEIAYAENLKVEISGTEYFPAIENDNHANEYILNAAIENNFEIQMELEPFRWSEDFAQLTNRYKGAMFGMGAGTNCRNLHDSKYDFPDDIIESGIKMFSSIYQQILANSKFI